MKLTMHVWSQDKIDKELGHYRVEVDAEKDGHGGYTILNGALTREELIALRDGEPIEWTFNFPQGGVRL
jgi:hypothetical protein